jgi:hypothetical protein
MADVLRQHIEQCPKHPLSHAKAELATVKANYQTYVDGVDHAMDGEVKRLRAIVAADNEFFRLDDISPDSVEEAVDLQACILDARQVARMVREAAKENHGHTDQ